MEKIVVTEKSKPTSKKRIWSWILGSFSGLILLYAVFLAIWHFSFSEEGIKRMLTTFAEEEFAADISVERAWLDLFPLPAIQLRNLQISPRQGLPLLAEEVTINPNIFPLLWGEIKPSNLKIVHPQIPLMTDERGRLKLGGFFPSDKSSKALKYKGHMLIEGAAITYLPYQSDNYITIEAADFDGEIISNSEENTVIAGGIKFHNISSLDRTTQKPEFTELDLAFRGDIGFAANGSSWQISDGHLWLGKAELGIKLDSTSKPNETETQIRLFADKLDLGEAFSVLPDSLLPIKKDLTIGGNVQIDLEYKVSKENTAGTASIVKSELNGFIELADVECGYVGDKDKATSIKGELGFAENSLELIGIEGNVAEQQFHLSGKATDISQPNWDLQAKGRFPLGILARMLGLPADWKISGYADIDATMSGSMKEPSDLLVIGKLTPQNATVNTPFLKEPFTAVTGDIKLGGSSFSANLIAKLGNGNLSITGDVSDWAHPKLVLNARADNLDFDALLGKIEKTSSNAPLPSPSAVISPPKNEPQIELNCTIDRCKLLGIIASNINSRTNYNQGILLLKQLTASGYGGSLSLKGDINLTGEKPRYNLTADLVDVEINGYLGQETTLKDNVLGKLSAHVNCSGSGTDTVTVKKTLEVWGTASLKQGRIKDLPPLVKLAEWSGISLYKDLPIDSIKTNFQIKGGTIYIKNAQETGPAVDMQLAGDIKLDLTLDLKVNNLFSLQNTQKILGTNQSTKIVRDTKGRGVIAFITTGEAKDPEFMLDPKEMGKVIAGGNENNTGGSPISTGKTPPEPSQAPAQPSKWF